jgi:hypothetical protein
MRTRLFIALSLIVLFLCGSLPAASAQSQSSAIGGPEASAGLNAGESNATTRSDAAAKAKSEATWTGASEATCYAIRSYLVKRESPKSDVTSLVGYSTCLPSRNIELKRSEFQRSGLNGSDLSRSELNGSRLSGEFSPDNR